MDVCRATHEPPGHHVCEMKALRPPSPKNDCALPRQLQCRAEALSVLFTKPIAAC